MRLTRAHAATSALGAFRDVCLHRRRHRLPRPLLRKATGGGVAAAVLALLPFCAFADSGTPAKAESPIRYIEPRSAHVSGGIEMTFHTRDFMPPEETQVYFDDTPASITRWSVYGYDCLYTYSCIVPPHEEERVDIGIVALGRETVVIHHAFDYLARAQLNLPVNTGGGLFILLRDSCRVVGGHLSMTRFQDERIF